MGRHSNWDAGTPGPVRRSRPLYARLLRLRHIEPGGVTCFFFFEGMMGLAAVLALTGLVTWWAVPVLPLCVAAMVKLNDLVAGRLAPPDRPRTRSAPRDEESVRRAAAARSAAAAPPPADNPPPKRPPTGPSRLSAQRPALESGATAPQRKPAGERRPAGGRKPAGERQTSADPAAERPGAQRPGAQRPGAQRSGVQRPGAQRSGAVPSGAERAGAQRGGAGRPGAEPPAGQQPPASTEAAGTGPASTGAAGTGPRQGESAKRRPAAARQPRAIEAGAAPSEPAEPGPAADRERTDGPSTGGVHKQRRQPTGPIPRGASAERAGADEKGDRKHAQRSAPETADLPAAQPDALVDFLTHIQDDGVPLSPDGTPSDSHPGPEPQVKQGEPRRSAGGAHVPASPADPAKESAQRRARRGSRAGREKHG